LQRQGESRRRRPVADRLRAEGVDRRRSGQDRRAREESGELRPPTSTKEELVMKSNRMRAIAIVTALGSALGGRVVSAQDKYTLKVPGGLAFSEFRGYEAWQVVS